MIRSATVGVDPVIDANGLRSFGISEIKLYNTSRGCSSLPFHLKKKSCCKPVFFALHCSFRLPVFLVASHGCCCGLSFKWYRRCRCASVTCGDCDPNEDPINEDPTKPATGTLSQASRESSTFQTNVHGICSRVTSLGVVNSKILLLTTLSRTDERLPCNTLDLTCVGS